MLNMLHRTTPLLACVFVFVQLTDGFSVLSANKNSFLDWHRKLVAKRQTDEHREEEYVSGGGWDDMPACHRQLEACAAALDRFTQAWVQAYETGTPFQTSAPRVTRFCSDVAATRQCVTDVGPCPGSYIPQAIADFNACEPRGRAALIAINGLTCSNTVDNDPLARQCFMDYINSLSTTTTTTTTTTPDPLIDWSEVVNATYVSHEYGSRDMCGQGRARLDCTKQSFGRLCGQAMSDFIEVVQRPSVERVCQRQQQQN